MGNRQLGNCSICGKPNIARGYCLMHYRRWHRHGDPHYERKKREFKPQSPARVDEYKHLREALCQAFMNNDAPNYTKACEAIRLMLRARGKQ